ncbi:helix-turn-helix domain-containing protein [Fusibacter ferrireducens]|uniref:Helix-turn-helix transcriptional regulator n=1 Tax=Fusibacter ferrireducens TaxID=2785058 RepID=A0ABR9ZRC1_9FIRM|nr:helix-turn-helix transcriptional regulator [Fusibacter ferrireducens]MBF4692703.1 helix-turn-helix transcriptional regulator [Fusibacter ferrireducens]
MNRLAEKIKNARIAANLTEKELAQKSGVSISYLLQVESGKKVISEKIADQILSSLGEKIEFIDPKLEAQEKASEKPMENKKVASKQQEQSKSKDHVVPTGQWQDALSGIVKRIPIYDLVRWENVGYKEHPVIDNKVEGYNGDKLLYVKVTNNQVSGLRIKMNDLVFVLESHEIGKNGIYLLEYQNKRIIRQVMKVNNRELSLIQGGATEAEIVEQKKVKVIGKCLRVSFDL